MRERRIALGGCVGPDVHLYSCADGLFCCLEETRRDQFFNVLFTAIRTHPRRHALNDDGGDGADRLFVSILARPEGRALHDAGDRYASPVGFQSSPAPKDGRYRGRREQGRGNMSFNPRPPRRTGATRVAF